MKKLTILAIAIMLVSCSPDDDCQCVKETYQIKPSSKEKGRLMKVEDVLCQPEGETIKGIRRTVIKCN